MVKEIAQQLPAKTVICWKDDHFLSLPVCAMNKFVREKSYCKRCTLFQGDDHSDLLYKLVEEWERDDLEDEDAS